ncbi:hypothetical protein BPAE_0318g00080 [Botrytis paeoniae]|uniref:Pectate lyase superfamily protein domain-containing protein n=1 Tax=Botrytis paeoniae TaxID=278948 RepID=A0A4Z1FBK9_9HELO|nr:hypothetical protein BPAE_0318g00080 [Botrytis paeoniae]
MLSRIFLTALGFPLFVSPSSSTAVSLVKEKRCIVEASANGGDDAPAIIHAFEECGHNDGITTHGTVVFKNATYNIQTVMNTTGLSNVKVDLHGTLLWDTKIPYWLNNSLPVEYQNQSSVWLFGGENVHWDGHGYGTLNGMERFGVTNCIFENLRFVQSQMWTMTIIHAKNILLEDIYVNSTDVRPVGFEFISLNTDGADTIYADNITFRGWTVDNGDDSISMKANSTNILIEDCDFYTGLGVAIGSIEGRYEVIENVTARNIRSYNMRYGVYMKTWTGVSTGYPPNGGGAGLGHATNFSFTNFTLHNNTGIIAITQCTSYNSATGNCDTSLFNLSNMTFASWSGTASSDVVAELQCSGATPCTGILIEGMEGILDTVNNTKPAQYLCDSVVEPNGFNCTGVPFGENPR